MEDQPMTETATLPGLETVDPPTPEGERKRWIERGPQKRLMLFSGSSNRELAERIAETLGVELGEVRLKTFANGETYCRYEDSIRGADVFIVQSGNPPVNDHLMELLIMIQAAKLASAKRITAVVPWFPYSRQDKKSAPREPITAKLVADALEVAGVDRVVAIDLHAGQIQGFFNVPVDHMTALQLFAQYYRDKGLQGDGVVAVSPDPGRAKMARRFGQMLDGDLAIMNKTRPEHDRASVTEVIGDVRGKVAIMSDDMIVTGGPLIPGAQALREPGATQRAGRRDRSCVHAREPGDPRHVRRQEAVTEARAEAERPGALLPVRQADEVRLRRAGPRGDRQLPLAEAEPEAARLAPTSL